MWHWGGSSPTHSKLVMKANRDTIAGERNSLRFIEFVIDVEVPIQFKIVIKFLPFRGEGASTLSFVYSIQILEYMYIRLLLLNSHPSTYAIHGLWR